MKKLFKIQSSGWIDLYLNDAHGVSLSMKEMVKEHAGLDKKG
jgi:hypothetical protein